jgi:tetratricopeptide (TPR) repeat protein
VEGAVTAHRRSAFHARILASLRALGCDDDARMAFYAEAAGDGPAALRHASAAARRAAALASHREAAAQFERALRFTDGADPATYCDDHDITTYSIFMRSERTSALERTDRWDEAVAICHELLRKGGPSPNIRLCPLNRLGAIRARRSEPGAWECLSEAIEYADGAGEPQSIVAVRLARAEALWLDGKLANARREAELADDAASGCDRWDRGAAAVWLQRTGSARPPRGELRRCSLVPQSVAARVCPCTVARG